MITLDTNIAAGNATTQYLNFDFNSMTKFGNKFFCANASGIYELDGTTNMFPSNPINRENIESYFELITFDFDISSQKRLRAVYLGYEATGTITLKIYTELSSEHTYQVPATTSGRMARKININRSLKGRYWTFEIYGQNTTYAIDMIQVLPIVRSHGFDKN